MHRPKVVSIVNLSQNQHLLVVLKDVLQSEGIELKYVNMCDVKPSDRILIARGFTPVISFRLMLKTQLRGQAIVLMHISKNWPVSQDEARMSSIEKQICNLGYGCAAVGLSEKELACYALRIISD